MISMTDVAEVLGHAESVHHSKTMIVLSLWGCGQTKIDPVRQVKVTYHSEQFGIQIQVDGSLSCIVNFLRNEHMWKKFMKRKENLPNTKRWQAVHKWSNRVHNPILSL